MCHKKSVDMRIAGVDLAEVETKPTGFYIIDKNFKTKTSILSLDEEIIRETEKVKPDVISRRELSCNWKSRRNFNDFTKKVVM